MTDVRRHTLATEFLQRRKRRAARVARVARVTERDRKASTLFRQAYASGILALEMIQFENYNAAWRARTPTRSGDGL